MLYLRAWFSDKANDDYSIFVSFNYNPNYVTLIKSLPNRYWNNDKKEWEIPYSNYSQLIGILNSNNIPYNADKFMESIKNLQNEVEKLQTIQKQDADVDASILDNVEFKTQPYKFQRDGIAFGLEHDKFLLADEPGCVDEDTEIQINVSGASKKVTIKEAARILHTYKHFKSFKVRCLKDDYFGIHDVQDIFLTGNKPCFKLVLESGKQLIATGDHQILTEKGYIALQKLDKKTDVVIVNGKQKCLNCGSSENIIVYPYAKFLGYCKKCMYKFLRDDCSSTESRKLVKGYWFLTGSKYKGHHLNTPNGVPEHQYIAEQKYGRKLNLDIEVVHHLDYNSQNNDPNNLIILSKNEHAKLHGKEKYKHFFRKDYKKINGKEIIVVPKKEKIKSITFVGNKNVYDIKMKDPYHNFVANGIVVHNCGKTLMTSNIARLKRGGKHCLVVVGYKSLLFNWVREIELHTNEKGYVLGQRETKRTKKLRTGTLQDRLEDIENLDKIKEFFIITDITTLRQCRKEEYTKKNGKKGFNKIYFYADLLEEWCRKGEIGRIILDESHTCVHGKSLIKINNHAINMEKVYNKFCNNEKLMVECYNEKTNQIEYKPIINMYKSEEKTEFIKLHLQYKNKYTELICTPEHKIHTENRGWVEAQNLLENDEISIDEKWFNDNNLLNKYHKKQCKYCNHVFVTNLKDKEFCNCSCAIKWRNSQGLNPRIGKKHTKESIEKANLTRKNNLKYQEGMKYRMKFNNPSKNPKNIDKMKQTKLKNNTLHTWSGKRGGNGTVSRTENLIMDFMKDLKFSYNKAISTYDLRILFPEKHYAINYKPDFYNPFIKIGIEIDGNTHKTKLGILRDKKKAECLKKKGIKLIHFSNDYICNNLEDFKKEILKICQVQN